MFCRGERSKGFVFLGDNGADGLAPIGIPVFIRTARAGTGEDAGSEQESV